MDPREKEYISIFKQYAEQIYDSLVRFDNVKQVYYAFELGKQFRRVCTIIGKDPRFLGMNKFLNVVRKKDREYIDYLKGLKRKYKGHPKVSESERPDSQKFKPLIEKFYLKVDQIDPIPEKPKNIEFNQETKNERQKRLFYEGKNWISKRMKLSFSPEEEKIISKYRKELTKEERKELKYEMSPRDEIKVFKKYGDWLIGEFVGLESKGWYNSIKNSAPKWLNYLEKITNLRPGPEYEDFVNVVRKYYRNFEDWLQRVNRKYENRHDLALDEINIINPKFHEKIIFYKHIRRAYIRHNENLKILKKFHL